MSKATSLELLGDIEQATKELMGRVALRDLPAGVGRVLELSTAHMPSESPDWGDLRAVEVPAYGWVIWVAEPQYVDGPAWAKPVLKLARDLGCYMVSFDCDADEMGGLPRWDW